MRGIPALLTRDLISMVTEPAGSVRLRISKPMEVEKGGRSRPLPEANSLYAVTNFSWAIIDEIVSKIASMLRPVSVATST